MIIPNRFTLIEMLVVVSIIAILASLMMPSLTKALESARLTNCANNKRQIHLGFMAYSEDFGYLPPRDDGPPSYNRWYNGGFIGQYVGSPTGYNSNPKNEIFYCSSFDLAQAGDLGSGYTYCWDNYINRAPAGKQILRFANIYQPSRVILLVDTKLTYFWNSQNADLDYGPSYRHNGLAAILLAAGNTASAYDLSIQIPSGEYRQKASR